MPDLIDADDVCTHAQLNIYVGGQLAAQQHLLATVWDDTGGGGDASTKLREWAIDEVLAALASRTPPIYEADINIASELRRAVERKAAEKLYDIAMSGGESGELFYAKMKSESTRYKEALAQLRPTVAGGALGPPTTVGVSRR